MNNNVKDKCSQSKGDDCDTIILNHREFLNEIQNFDVKCHLLFQMWDMIVYNIIEIPNDQLKNLDMKNAQILLDLLYRVSVIYYIT